MTVQVINPGKTGNLRSDAYVATIDMTSPADKKWLRALREAVSESNRERRHWESRAREFDIKNGREPKKEIYRRSKRVSLRHRCKPEARHKYRSYIPWIKLEDAARTDVYIHEELRSI